MMTCMPSRMWTSPDATSSRRGMATCGLARVAFTVAWSAPARVTKSQIRKDKRKMLATAVRRWRQKCSAPVFAEPRPRTRARGVRCAISNPPTEHEADRPDGERQCDGAQERQPGQHIDLPDLQASAR